MFLFSNIFISNQYFLKDSTNYNVLDYRTMPNFLKYNNHSFYIIDTITQLNNYNIVLFNTNLEQSVSFRTNSRENIFNETYST